MRWRISPAARSVKVMTRIELAGAPAATSLRNRSAITAVFPVPAPATTRTAPRPMEAARACSSPSLTGGFRAWSIRVRRPPDAHPEGAYLAAEVKAGQARHDGFGIEPELVRQGGTGGGDQQGPRMQFDLVAQSGRFGADQIAECRGHLRPQQASAARLAAQHPRQDIAQLIHRLQFRPQRPSKPWNWISARVEKAPLRPM